MFAAPAEGTLKDFMEFGDTGCADHEQSPPHQRTHAAEHYAKLINRNGRYGRFRQCEQFTQAHTYRPEPTPRNLPLSRQYGPEPRGLVLRGGEHPPAVRAKNRAINFAGVALESDQELAALSLPEPRGLVVRGGEHPPAVRAKDRVRNSVGVALESGHELAALSLPEPRGLVVRGGAREYGPWALLADPESARQTTQQRAAGGQ
jgi:hypothetical protein